MFRALILAGGIGLVTLSLGMLVWQTDFAQEDRVTRWQPPADDPTHDGVHQDLTERAPVTAKVIAAVQGVFRAKDDTPDPPKVNRGGTSREGFDVRYTKRPGN